MPTYSPLPGLLPYHRTEAMSNNRSALNPINATNTISYFYFYSTLGGLGLQLHCGHIFELRIGILRSWYRRRRQDRAAVHLVRSRFVLPYLLIRGPCCDSSSIIRYIATTGLNIWYHPTWQYCMICMLLIRCVHRIQQQPAERPPWSYIRRGNMNE
ncbi:hypothetical protein B0H34DRAFT_427223 [Crassisporium funariophilum]|nr:hypothetical protein B0H34DRAFT_427223 [Crassisporium funariophilum]